MERLFCMVEHVRLRLHFFQVLTLLRFSNVPHGLSPAVRRRTRSVLRQYARAGRFPLHGGGGGPRPVFVDQQGTHCAVGHLLGCSGFTELVAQVSERKNHAFVRELVHVPGLLPAIAELGISPREAARIQPSYTPGTASCVVYLAWQLFATASMLVALPLIAAFSGSRAVRNRLWNRGKGRKLLSIAVLAIGLGGLSSYAFRSLFPPPEPRGMELSGFAPDFRRCGDVFRPSTWVLTGWGWL